jgi:hypothetical protein
MKYVVFLLVLMLCSQGVSAFSNGNSCDDFPSIVLSCDSDSVAVNRNAEVIRFDNRLYQMGIQIGTFDKKTSIAKAQLTTRIQIYNMEGKTVAEGLSQGINASFVVTMYPSQERFSISPGLDHEVEEIAGRLRVMGKL